MKDREWKSQQNLKVRNIKTKKQSKEEIKKYERMIQRMKKKKNI